jgi:hypothetical protein
MIPQVVIMAISSKEENEDYKSHFGGHGVDKTPLRVSFNSWPDFIENQLKGVLRHSKKLAKMKFGVWRLLKFAFGNNITYRNSNSRSSKGFSGVGYHLFSRMSRS